MFLFVPSLHLACFLPLALFSVLFICILQVLPYCYRFCHFKHFVLVSSLPALYCSFQFNFLISYFFLSFRLLFCFPRYSYYPFLSLLHFAVYFVLPYRHLHLFICFSPPGLRYSLPCYQLFVPYAFHSSFSGMRSSFVFFVCFLMTDVIYCIPVAFCLVCFQLEKFYLLFNLIPDVNHCTVLAFFQLAFRL